MQILFNIPEGFFKIWRRIHCLACESPAIAEAAIHGAFRTYEKNATIPVSLQQDRGNGNIFLAKGILRTRPVFFHNGRYGLPPDRTKRVGKINKIQIMAGYLKGVTRNSSFEGFQNPGGKR
jgi:hypothetical protein